MCRTLVTKRTLACCVRQGEKTHGDLQINSLSGRSSAVDIKQRCDFTLQAKAIGARRQHDTHS